MAATTDIKAKIAAKAAEKKAKDAPTPAKAAKAAPAKTTKETTVPETTTPETAETKKSRRNPLQMLQALRDQRQRWEKEHADRMERLDGRIAKLEQENEDKVKAMEELAEGKTAEDIDAEIQALIQKRRAIKKVLKAGVEIKPVVHAEASDEEATEA